METRIGGWDDIRCRATQILEDLHARDEHRSLEPAPNDLINLCSNDYLGLTRHTEWQSYLRRQIKGKMGAGASRLLGGDAAIFSQVETEFSQFKSAESSLFFGSGYAANESVIQTLARLEPHFFSDAWNHASIIDGFRVARIPESQRTVFRHADFEQLESRLSASESPINVIITESLFSMDGDTADLHRFLELARQYRAILVVDEAHALGVLGCDGRGAIDAAGLDHHEIISVNTLGKALGAQGAFVAGPSWFREMLINFARPFIFSTAPSPWLAEAIGLVLQQLPKLERRRERLRSMASLVLQQLQAAGLDTGESNSHIIPVIVGAASEALHLAQHLKGAGFFIRAIRPPTVAPHSSRIRISLTADLQQSDARRLVEAICQWEYS